MFRVVFAVVGALGLVLLPSVAAQVGSTAATIQIKDLATGTSFTNDTVFIEKFTVQVRAQNMVCSSNTNLVVNIAATSSRSSMQSDGASNWTVAFELTPSQSAFAVPAGQYVTTPYEGSQESSLVVRPSSIPNGGTDVPVSLKATMSPVAGCQGDKPVAASPQEADFTVHFGRGTEAAPIQTTPEMPGPGVALLALALVVGLLVMRRRGA